MSRKTIGFVQTDNGDDPMLWRRRKKHTTKRDWNVIIFVFFSSVRHKINFEGMTGKNNSIKNTKLNMWISNMKYSNAIFAFIIRLRLLLASIHPIWDWIQYRRQPIDPTVNDLPWNYQIIYLHFVWPFRCARYRSQIEYINSRYAVAPLKCLTVAMSHNNVASTLADLSDNCRCHH